MSSWQHFHRNEVENNNVNNKVNSTCGSAVNSLYIKMANRLVTPPRPDGTSRNPGNLVHLYSALMSVKSCKCETYTDNQTRKQKVLRLHGDVAALVHPPKWTQKHTQFWLIQPNTIIICFLREWEIKKWVSGRMINPDYGPTVPPGGGWFHMEETSIPSMDYFNQAQVLRNI